MSVTHDMTVAGSVPLARLRNAVALATPDTSSTALVATEVYGNYVPWPYHEAPDMKYDLIFIDGRLRADCAAVARHCLAEGGVILLHDAHRENYGRVFELFGGGEVVLNTGIFESDPLENGS